MTCRRVAWVHPTCTCGALLQLGVDHGDDELGNPLCPTCSGCGCEPNERNLMNEQELERLGRHVGRLLEHANTLREVQECGRPVGRWVAEPVIADLEVAHFLLSAPVPEPDHSMCARLVRHPDDPRNRHGLQSPNGSYLTLPHDGPAFVAPDDYWRERGYAIPEPEPTVVERAAKVLGETLGHGDEPELACALDRAGLLVRDGEQ